MIGLETPSGYLPVVVPPRPGNKQEGANPHTAKVPPEPVVDRDRAVSPVQLTEDGHPIRGGEETALAPTGKSRQVQEQVQELAQRVTEALRDVDFPANTSLRFKVDDETEEVVFQVVNRDTEEVVRQYPREEVLDRLALAKDFKGLMLDQEG